MMNKRGFTLTEVLITLGIIGVIAALTIPALVQSGQNEANAAKLSVVVSTLENALTTMIAREGAPNLYGTKAWGVVQGAEWEDNGNPDDVNNTRKLNISSNEDDIAAFAGRLGQYMQVSGYAKEAPKTYYDNKGPYAMTSSGGTSTDYSSSLDDCFALELKNGATIFMRAFANGDGNSKRTQEDMDKVIEQGGALFSDAADLFIDVNGKNAPNTAGRDIFHGYLGSDGIFYPVGGKDTSIYEGRGLTDTWDNTNSGSWRTCLPENNNVKTGFGCTARVIEEGYKINY